ncbi:MAG: hypothetical protein ACODAG_07645, partial [Myxococcota bacterium]
PITRGLRRGPQSLVLGLVSDGSQMIPFGDIVLIETNKPRTVINTGAPILGVTTAVSMGTTVFCAASPKTCFGSCPTFYAELEGEPTLLAEGFSASVARVLEETDVDSLHGVRAGGGHFDLEMRNEALETHFVRSARLLALPVGEGPVMRSGAAFHRVSTPVAPKRCRGSAGNCREAVSALDARAYASRTDPADLGAPEEILLSFPAARGPRALVIAGRNSLVQTFLFYRFIALLGPDVGTWFAAVERGGDEVLRRALEMKERVAHIRVDVRTADGSWREAGVYDEVGPIAQDVQLVPLPETDGHQPLEVRLRLTRGYWKLDWVNVVDLGDRVSPLPLEPQAIVDARGHLGEELALATLRDPAEHLMTLPGDRYVIRYDVPPGEHALFLESRGYYYEWQRETWREHHDPVAALRFVMDPEGELRRLAPRYKRLEARAEELFWSSRVGGGAGR